jgi:RNA polymerase sigma-70 factor (ECF subfamily)
MRESPVTRPSLLVRLGDPRDNQAWEQFVEIYAPLVYGFARKHGLQDADAADLTQDVLRAVAGASGQGGYNPERGSFRAWFFTIVRNKLRNFVTRRQRHCLGTGDSEAQAFLEAQPARPEPEAALWEQEYEQRLFAWAVERVRDDFADSTWQAFWRTAVVGDSAGTVAEVLGMSAGAVYIAKSRVLARLREQIQQLQEW